MDVKLKVLNYYWDEKSDVINLYFIDMYDNYSYFQIFLRFMCMGFFLLFDKNC